MINWLSEAMASKSPWKKNLRKLLIPHFTLLGVLLTVGNGAGQEIVIEPRESDQSPSSLLGGAPGESSGNGDTSQPTFYPNSQYGSQNENSSHWNHPRPSFRRGHRRDFRNRNFDNRYHHRQNFGGNDTDTQYHQPYQRNYGGDRPYYRNENPNFDANKDRPFNNDYNQYVPPPGQQYYNPYYDQQYQYSAPPYDPQNYGYPPQQQYDYNQQQVVDPNQAALPYNDPRYYQQGYYQQHQPQYGQPVYGSPQGDPHAYTGPPQSPASNTSEPAAEETTNNRRRKGKPRTTINGMTTIISAINTTTLSSSSVHGVQPNMTQQWHPQYKVNMEGIRRNREQEREEAKKGKIGRFFGFMKGIFRKVTGGTKEKKDEKPAEQADSEEDRKPSWDRNEGRNQNQNAYRQRVTYQGRNYEYNYNPNYRNPDRNYHSERNYRNPKINFDHQSSGNSDQNHRNHRDHRAGNNFNNPSHGGNVDQNYRNPRDNFNNANPGNSDQGYKNPIKSNFNNPSTTNTDQTLRDFNTNNQQNPNDRPKYDRNENKRFNYKPYHYNYNNPDFKTNKPGYKPTYNRQDASNNNNNNANHNTDNNYNLIQPSTYGTDSPVYNYENSNTRSMDS